MQIVSRMWDGGDRVLVCGRVRTLPHVFTYVFLSLHTLHKDVKSESVKRVPVCV